ncbi:MAG TPA: DUF2339 domain-containing protein [Arenimonas sp.]|nr:DUF2339 domain-containing protein [Arenimonas sp.]
MNWLIGFIALLVGAALSQERWLLGGTLGFFIGWLLSSMSQLRSRLDGFEAELMQARDAFRKMAAERDQLSARLKGINPAAPVAPETIKPEPQKPVPPPIPVPAPSVVPADTRKPAGPNIPVQTPPPVMAEKADVANRAVFTGSEPTPRPAATAPPPVDSANIPRSSTPDVTFKSVSRESSWDERLVDTIKRWFTEGNVPVKVGVIVTFFGVAALLRYAYVQGYFTFPIEYRLIMIAVAALAALAFGWRERESNPAFGLSLQGGAIGTLMLTIFAAYKYFGLLPPGLSFGLIVLLVAGAAMLAILQDTMWIAVLGLLGGYLAPVLISTGSGNHIALFSYYAILNTAVFAIAWKKSWRVLNLMGFVFTFGVGTAWGVKYYKPELFDTVEPFLILFFVFYTVIGLLYVIKQTEYRKPWVDGTLVFGTPLLAFPLQAKLLADNRIGLAFSALVISIIYGGMVYFLHRRKNERLLAEAYGALALGFATLAIPLAFSAATTATVWALEGVGVAWIGLRQKRTLPIVTGVLLQLLAAGSFMVSVINEPFNSSDMEQLVLNPHYLGAFIIAISGFMLSLIFKRLSNSKAVPVMLFLWASAWWFGSMLHDFDIAERSIGIWQYSMLYFSITILVATLLQQRMEWSAMKKLAAFSIMSAPVFVLFAADKFSAPLMMPTWAYWAAFLLGSVYALWREANDEAAQSSRAGGFMHIVLLWSAALAFSLQWQYQVDNQWDLAQGWYAPAICLPIGLMTLGLWRMRNLFSWPMQHRFDAYDAAWFIPAFALLSCAWVIGLFLEGSPAPLMYVPIINPLELSLLAAAALFAGYIRHEKPDMEAVLKLWPYIGLVFITMATLRSVHHLHGEPWNAMILNSGFTQASLTIVWSLLGVAGLILGSTRGDRKQWMGGGLLMLIVLGKLVLVDRTYMGNIPGIVSCLAVGLLLVVVGYFAPQPPKQKETA